LPPEAIARLFTGPALLNLANEIEDGVSAVSRRTDKIIQAVLAKAFRGELARAEGRSYETAAEMLRRFRQATNHLPEAKRRKRS
jgi:hypothetical protein